MVARRVASAVFLAALPVFLADRSGEGILSVDEDHEDGNMALEAHAGGSFHRVDRQKKDKRVVSPPGDAEKHDEGKQSESLLAVNSSLAKDHAVSLLAVNDSKEVEKVTEQANLSQNSSQVTESNATAAAAAASIQVSAKEHVQVHVSTGEGSGLSEHDASFEKKGASHALHQQWHNRYEAEILARKANKKAAQRYVLIRGAEGLNAGDINGDYVDTGRLYNGKPLFRKETNADRWLRFVKAGNLNQWRVSTTESMKANTDKGFIYSGEKDLVDPTMAQNWFVWSGTAWERQDTIVVLESEASPLLSKPEEVVPPPPAGADVEAGSRVATAVLRWMLIFVLFLVLPLSSVALFMWFMCFWRQGKSCPLGETFPETAALLSRWCFPILAQRRGEAAMPRPADGIGQ